MSQCQVQLLSKEQPKQQTRTPYCDDHHSCLGRRTQNVHWSMDREIEMESTSTPR